MHAISLISRKQYVKEFSHSWNYCNYEPHDYGWNWQSAVLWKLRILITYETEFKPEELMESFNSKLRKSRLAERCFI